jgi:hypothetical protein
MTQHRANRVGRAGARRIQATREMCAAVLCDRDRHGWERQLLTADAAPVVTLELAPVIPEPFQIGRTVAEVIEQHRFGIDRRYGAGASKALPVFRELDGPDEAGSSILPVLMLQHGLVYL